MFPACRLQITNVVEACNLDGRLERLENLLSQLEMCEKALQDYLETKRIAFPRFYFVAPADLLDILSKGSNPQLILRHLPKNFDNVHNLKFRLDDKGDPTKNAVSNSNNHEKVHKVLRQHAQTSGSGWTRAT
jgi:dynein heavy chain